jgi:fatty-acid desaturase
MGLILVAAIIVALAFGLGALVHFLWLGLIVLAIVFLASFVVNRA